MVGYFDRKTSDVGNYVGLWAPSDSELTSEFERLLSALAGNDQYWRGVLVTYRKTGSKTRHFGLVHDFGSGFLVDAPNEMSVRRMTADKLVGLLQGQGIVNLEGSRTPE